MKHYDAVVVGSGPSGLTTAYFLARAGLSVAVLERDAQPGGLMRGILRGEFSLDIGRKELYTRFDDVHHFWKELLGDDYRRYAHYKGIVSDGVVMGKSRRAILALPLRSKVRLAASFLWAQLKPGDRMAANLEDYYLLKFGRNFYELFVYGFQRKFRGVPVRDLPLRGGSVVIRRFEALYSPRAEKTIASDNNTIQDVWYHPARGTNQIVHALESGARSAGAVFYMNSDVREIVVDGGHAHVVRALTNEGMLELEARNVVAAIPLRILIGLLNPSAPPELLSPPKNEIVFNKSTVLVYLFSDAPPRFEHNWLEVTDMSLRVGRIVNYATYGGDMVPVGKTALCMEYFCVDGDGLIDRTQEEFESLARGEAVRVGLLDECDINDALVIMLPKADAATDHRDWEIWWMQKVQDYIREIPNLFETNRPGMDRASLAGMDAAEACRTGAPMASRSLETKWT